MIVITVRGAEKLAVRLAQMAHGITADLAKSVDRAAALVQRDVKQAMTGTKTRDPFWGVRGPSPESYTVATRSGTMRNRTTTRTFREGHIYFAAIGTDVPYAKIIENGGTIHGSPMLRIPTALEQTAAGVDKHLEKMSRGSPPGYFIWPNAKQRAGGKMKTKHLWLAKAEGGKLTLRYLLVPSVTIKPRHLFEKSAERMAPIVAKEVDGAVALTVRGGA